MRITPFHQRSVSVPALFSSSYRKSLVISLFLVLPILTGGCATIGARLAHYNGLQEEGRDCAASFSPQAKVALADCARISRLIQMAGISDGYAGYDDKGRVRLKGSYENEDDVDRAFVIAQTVVGAQGTAVSPVTPRNIAVIRMVRRPEGLSTEPGGRAKRYGLIIGVSRFKNPSITPISAPDRDAKEFQALLQNAGYDRVVTLVNEAATREAILREFRHLLRVARPNDRVFVYFSSHGTPPDKLGKLGIVPYDFASNIESAGDLFRTGNAAGASDAEILRTADLRHKAFRFAVTKDDLRDFLDQLRAVTGRTVTVLDTCYSGAALGSLTDPLGGERYVASERNYAHAVSSRQMSELIGGKDAKDLYVDADAVRSTQFQAQTLRAGKQGDYDYKNLPTPRPERDAAKNSGWVIVTASSGQEPSRFDSEGKTPIRTSYFTYYFVKGLKALSGQTQRAFEFAKVRTSQLVRDLTSGQATQTPQMESTPKPDLNLQIF